MNGRESMFISFADRLLALVKANVAFIAPVGLMVFVVLSAAAIEVTSITPFCGTCHSMKKVYAQWEKSTHASPKFGDQVGCSDCHVRNGVIGLVQDHIVNGSFQLLSELTHVHLPPRPRVVTAMHDERCLSCHRSVSSRDDELSRERLPEALKEIGLVVPHLVHYELRDFTSAERMRLNELESRSRKGLAPEEVAERRRLLKIRRGNCAQCHSRETRDAEGNPVWPKDRSMLLKQPMTCVSCHSKVVHSDHREDGRRNIPSRQTCLSCHNGRYHGKLGVIFEIGCALGKTKLEGLSDAEMLDCMKCHPGIQELLLRRASRMHQTGE